MPAVDPATLEHAQFAPLVGSKFQLRHGDNGVAELDLIEAKALGRGRAHPGAKREPFSLLFRAASPRFYLPQSMYPLHHASLGSLELFLVPLGPDATGMRFEAILA